MNAQVKHSNSNTPQLNFNPEHSFQTIEIEHMPMDFDMNSNQNLEDIIVAVVKVNSIDSLIHINLLDYLLVRSAYGLNLSFMSFNLSLHGLSKKERESVAGDIIAALEIRDIDFFFKGVALQKMLDLLNLEHSEFCNITGIQYAQIRQSLNDNAEITRYSYLTIISLFRFISTFANATQPMLDPDTVKKWRKFKALCEIDELSNVKLDPTGYSFTYSAQDVVSVNSQLSGQHKKLIKKLKDYEKFHIGLPSHIQRATGRFSIIYDNITFDVTDSQLDKFNSKESHVDLAVLLIESAQNEHGQTYECKTKLTRDLSFAARYRSSGLPEDVELGKKKGTYIYSKNKETVHIDRELIKQRMSKNDVLGLVKSIKSKHKFELKKDIYSLSKSLSQVMPSYVTKILSGYTIKLDSEEYCVRERDIRLYFIGYRKSILAENDVKKEHVADFSIAMDAITHQHFTQKLNAQKKFKVVEKFEDSVDLTYPYITIKTNNSTSGFNVDLPFLNDSGIMLNYNGVDNRLSIADLLDLHSGLHIPQALVNQDFELTESNFYNLDLIAHQFFINSDIYCSTWVGLLKNFKIKQGSLKDLRIRELEAYFTPEFADKKLKPWQFLALPLYANEANHKS